MRILNANRREALRNSQFLKYFKYAIGEIVLIVIGILIALQLNNLRDKRQDKNKLQSILGVIQSDLAQDTQLISNIEKWYAPRIDLVTEFGRVGLSDEIIDSSKTLVAFLFSYHPIDIEITGINLLKNHERIMNSIYSDSLLKLIQMYNEDINLIELSEDLVKQEIQYNVHYYSLNYPWYHQLMTAQNHQGFKDHVRDDQFKNRFVNKSMLEFNNYLSNLIKHKKRAIEWISKLEKMK